MAEDLRDLEGQLVNYGRLEEEEAEKARAAAAKVEKIKAERAALEDKVRAAGGTVPRVSAGNGNRTDDDVEKRISRQEADAALFDKLLGQAGALVDLYNENPTRFYELRDAKATLEANRNLEKSRMR